jgi:hypothetical protein
MKPEHRFHAFVTSTTVLVMYYFIQHLVPMLHFSPPFDHVIKPVASLLSAVGIYKTLASFLLLLTRRWKWVMRWFLGSSYLNGTWIGKFHTSTGEVIFTVEHFEQTLSSLKIRGQAFHAGGSSYAYWNSVSESIDEAAGLLSYAYNCDKNAENNSFQGIGVFHFERRNERSAPYIIHGYSADLVDGERSENTESKISENLIPFKEALILSSKA